MTRSSWRAQRKERRSRPKEKVAVDYSAAAAVMFFVGFFTFLGALGAREVVALVLSLMLVATVISDRILATRAVRYSDLWAQPATDSYSGEPIRYRLTARSFRSPITLSTRGTPHLGWTLVSGTPTAIDFPGRSRGVYNRDRWQVSASGPFGLVTVSAEIPVLWGGPLFVTAGRGDEVLGFPDPETMWFGSPRPAPLGDALFKSVRDYVPGDQRRSIHWPATAKMDEVLVKETDGMGASEVRIVAATPLGGGQLEAVFNRALRAGRAALAEGVELTLVTMEPEWRPENEGEAQLDSYSWDEITGTQRPVFLVNGQTMSRRVKDVPDLQRRLASACYGIPRSMPFHGVTLYVSPSGDYWEGARKRRTPQLVGGPQLMAEEEVDSPG